MVEGRGMSGRVGIMFPRHGRARPGHPRLVLRLSVKTWMPGTSPGMTGNGVPTDAVLKMPDIRPPLHPRHCERSEAIHSFLLLLGGLLRRIRLRPKAGYGGQEG